MLTKEQIRAAADPAPVAVEIPEWNGEVFVKEMSARERDRFESLRVKGDDVDRDNIRAHLAVLTVCDEAGNLLFEPSDADWLGAKSAGPLTKIWKVSAKINGLTAEAENFSDADSPKTAGDEDSSD